MSALFAIGLALSSPFEAFGQGTGFTSLGPATGYERVPGGVVMRTAKASVMVQSVRDVGFRVRVRFAGMSRDFPVARSLATDDRAPTIGSATVREEGDTVVVTAEGMVARLTRHPVRVVVRDAAANRELLRETLGAGEWSGRVMHVLRDEPGTRYFGAGEQPSAMDREGAVFPLWNTDRGVQVGQTPIYSSFPFYTAVRDGVAHGVLYDNPFKAEMDFGARMKGGVAYTAEGGIDGGELRYYVMRGPGLDSVLARYSRLTGRTPLPPRWALGYHQSRYSYHPDTQVANLASEFRRRRIPADVIHLDIHFMDGYRVFTWSPTEFSRPKALLDSLSKQGLRVVTIVDPGVKVDSAYRVYREGLARHAFVRLPDGAEYVGQVWPGRSVFPDFSSADARSWWGEQHRVLLDAGVAGIWNDMNEPASFGGQTIPDYTLFSGDGRPGTHLEFHNQYATLEAKATYEALRRLRPEHRPFIVSRAGYTGMQRYASLWTGDTYSTWEQLRISLPMVLSLGLSGLPFAGDDVGGFNGSPSADLFQRWLESAVLLPFARTHSSIDSPRREPWSFGPEFERANRAAISLRYRMLPTIYTAFWQHTVTGSPIVRPVFWNALADSAALATQTEYMLGDHLLVAPVVDSAVSERSVYLPAGNWYRLGDGGLVAGGRSVRATAPNALLDGSDTTALRGLPLYVRSGAVLSMQAVMQYTGERTLDTLELHVFPGEATSHLYEDAGEGYDNVKGGYRHTTMRTTTDAGGLHLTFEREGRYAGARIFAVTVADVPQNSVVTVDGAPASARYDAQARTLHFSVSSTSRRIDVRR